MHSLLHVDKRKVKRRLAFIEEKKPAKPGVCLCVMCCLFYYGASAVVVVGVALLL